MKKLLTMLSIISSVYSCSSIPLPDANIGIVNAPFSEIKGYNLHRDYDLKTGVRHPDAVPFTHKLTSLDDLNKYMCVSDTDWPKIKAYLDTLRTEYQSSSR